MSRQIKPKNAQSCIVWIVAECCFYHVFPLYSDISIAIRTHQNWISLIARCTYLILYGHHQYAANFEQYFHVIFVIFLHSSTTINAIVLVTVCGDFQAIPHHKGWLTELKPVKRTIKIWEKLSWKCVFLSVRLIVTFLKCEKKNTHTHSFRSIFTHAVFHMRVQKIRKSKENLSNAELFIFSPLHIFQVYYLKKSHVADCEALHRVNNGRSSKAGTFSHMQLNRG